MTDDQFKELCSALNFTNGHMTYMDFVENFDDMRIGMKWHFLKRSFENITMCI